VNSGTPAPKFKKFISVNLVGQILMILMSTTIALSKFVNSAKSKTVHLFIYEMVSH